MNIKPKSAELQILLLAAGEGTRLKPITDHLPKPLIDVCGVSILARLCNQLSNIFVDAQIWVNFSTFPNKFLDFYSDIQMNSPINFIWEPTRLGGAVTLNVLCKKTQGPILVVHSDLVLSEEYVQQLRELLVKTKFQKNLIFCHTRKENMARSKIDFDSSGMVINAQEGKLSHASESVEISVNSGIYFFSSPVSDLMSDQISGDIISNQIPFLIKKNILFAAHINELRISVDSLRSLELAREYLALD